MSGFVFVQRNIDKKLKSPIIAEMPNFPANDFGYEQAAINAEKERSGKKRKASKQKEKKDAKKVRFNPEAYLTILFSRGNCLKNVQLEGDPF